MSAGQIDSTGYHPVLVKKNVQLTVDSTAGGVAFATPGAAIGCYCNVETAPIRITEDGATAPTTAVGTLYNVGDRFLIWGHDNILAFRAIRATGTSATLTIEYVTEQ
jgi:hypothetical protein